MQVVGESALGTRRPWSGHGVPGRGPWRWVARFVVLVAIGIWASAEAHAGARYAAELMPKADGRYASAAGRITLDVNQVDETLRFALSVTGVDRIVGSHFHMVRWRTTVDGTQIFLDPEEGEGPIVAFFLGFSPEGVPGTGAIAEGVIEKAKLIGDFSKRPMGDLIEHLNAGHLYATVHALERTKAGRVFCCPIVLRGFFEHVGAN